MNEAVKAWLDAKPADLGMARKALAWAWARHRALALAGLGPDPGEPPKLFLFGAPPVDGEIDAMVVEAGNQLKNLTEVSA